MFIKPGLFSVSQQAKGVLAVALLGATLVTTASVSFAVHQNPVGGPTALCQTDPDKYCESNMGCKKVGSKGTFECDGIRVQYPKNMFHKRDATPQTKCVAGTGPCKNDARGLCSTYYISANAFCLPPYANEIQCHRNAFCNPK